MIPFLRNRSSRLKRRYDPLEISVPPKTEKYKAKIRYQWLWKNIMRIGPLKCESKITDIGNWYIVGVDNEMRLHFAHEKYPLRDYRSPERLLGDVITEFSVYPPSIWDDFYCKVYRTTNEENLQNLKLSLVVPNIYRKSYRDKSYEEAKSVLPYWKPFVHPFYDPESRKLVRFLMFVRSKSDLRFIPLDVYYIIVSFVLCELGEFES
jgi:hypothetical protein